MITRLRKSIKRGWEAFVTDRHNSTRWLQSTAQRNLNEDISAQVPTIRARCKYEACNNGFVKGIISTFRAHVVGKEGPYLRVLSDNDNYNNALETIFWDTWLNIDVNGQLSGPDKLGLWVEQLFTGGEFFEQFVTGPPTNGSSLRLYSLQPERVGYPYKTWTAGIVDGVRISESGKPIEYFVQSGSQADPMALQTYQFFPVRAENIIHGYQVTEPGQIRGIPWLAPVLPVVAQLRDYDKAVLDIAQLAASFGLGLICKDPDADPVNIGSDQYDLPRNRIFGLPPGYEPSVVKPDQPATNYVEFRKERLREVGRVVNMPLMLIQLDSSNHNYSSARFDDQVYRQSLKSTQGWLERVALNRIVDSIRREAELSGLIYGAKNVSYEWIWPAAPHVDPAKEANGIRTRLATGLTTLEEEINKQGFDLEAVIKQRQKEKALLTAAGLPIPWETYSDSPPIGDPSNA